MSPRREERETNEVDPKIFSGNCINAGATFEISSEMRNIFSLFFSCHRNCVIPELYTYVSPGKETVLSRNIIIFERINI